jgi:hypothetical protein
MLAGAGGNLSLQHGQIHIISVLHNHGIRRLFGFRQEQRF